jgi:hypothetical protein
MRKLRNKEFMKELKFDKCPSCGSPETVAKILNEEEQKKGNLTKEEYVNLWGFQAVITDPNKQSKLILSRKQVSAVQIVVDVCSECGCIFASKAVPGMAILEAAPNPKK